MPIQRYRTLLTCRLLLEYREHILYLIQTKSNGGGYTLPGGKIEGFEFAKEALIREAFEEIGIVLTPKALKLVHVTHKRLKSTSEIIFFFRAKIWKGEPIVIETDKFDKIAWLPHDELPKKLPAVVKNALERIAMEKNFTQFPKEKKKNKLKKVKQEKINELYETV